MGWRHAAIAGLLCCGCATQAPPLTLPNAPFLSVHQIELAGAKVAYHAEAGLMPIETPAAGRLGDMSYFAYTTHPPSIRLARSTRPIAFIWNGGPGSASSALHFGAFGPMRLQDGSLIPNENTLLGDADLVFVDQMESGYGRIAERDKRAGVLNPEGDADTFALFIEAYLDSHRLRDRPLILIGESYGVQRAARVAEKLRQRGIAPDGLVLISGYQAIGGQLSREEMGALRLLAAMTRTTKAISPSAPRASSAQDIFNRARAWLTPYLDKFARRETTPELSRQFADELAGLGGAELISYVRQAIGNPDDYIGNTFILLGRRDGLRIFDPALKAASAYDSRFFSDGSEWISRAVVRGIRESLGFSIDRIYRGQEFDASLNAAFILKDGAALPCESSQCQLPETVIPADRVAGSISNRWGFFRTRAPVTPPPLPLLMAASPDMKVFVIGGIFDDVFPCAIGFEMARRDLKGFAERVESKCYAGGHMMYFEPPVARALSTDVKAFIAKASRPSR